MKPLFTVAFFDGRLGHEKQTRGILNTLEKLTPIQVQHRTVDTPSFGSAIKNWCTYIGSYLTRHSETLDDHVDLIIGTGSYTHIPMLLLKKRCGAKIVTCMSPDPLMIRKFDLCFVPDHDNTRTSHNIFFTSGPPNTTRFTNEHDKTKGLILIGGIDIKSHRWDSNDVLTHVQSILKKTPSTHWTISSSPRTPEDMVLMLDTLGKQHANADFLRSAETPKGWIEDAYVQNHRVWVTADSISMIYEALTAGCMVGLLPVQWRKGNSKFVRSEKKLLAKGLVQSYDKWLAGETSEIKTTHLDEAARCAEEILRRWWPERLL